MPTALVKLCIISYNLFQCFEHLWPGGLRQTGEIIVDGQTFKFGIADANRLRKTGEFAGLPERLAQQLSKIAKYAPELATTHKIHQILYKTKAGMIEIETATILSHAEKLGIPLGNVTHIKKYVETLGKGKLSARAIEALSKFLKI